MPDGSYETRALDTRGVAEPLAAAPDAACHTADWVNRGDRAVERRAGLESAGAAELRPGRGGAGRRADADAGQPRRRAVPGAIIHRSAPRRLAGVAGAGRSRSDRRPLVPASWHRVGYAAGRGFVRAGDWARRPAVVRHAARRNTGRAGDAT